MGTETIREVIAWDRDWMLQGRPKGAKKASWCQSASEQEGHCEPLPCRKGMRWNLGKGIEQEGNFSPGTCSEKYGGRDTIRAVTIWLDFSII